MENSQIFLQEWEKKNNPFYPNEMRWDRVKINKMLAEYEAQKAVLPQADVIKSVCECDFSVIDNTSGGKPQWCMECNKAVKQTVL